MVRLNKFAVVTDRKIILEGKVMVSEHGRGRPHKMLLRNVDHICDFCH